MIVAYRNFLLILPVAGLVRLKHENSGYRIKINEKIINLEALKWNNLNIFGYNNNHFSLAPATIYQMF